MKDISLFEHNENAYEKLIKDLKRYKCTTINLPQVQENHL